MDPLSFENTLAYICLKINNAKLLQVVNSYK